MRKIFSRNTCLSISLFLKGSRIAVPDNKKNTNRLYNKPVRAQPKYSNKNLHSLHKYCIFLKHILLINLNQLFILLVHLSCNLYTPKLKDILHEMG